MSELDFWGGSLRASGALAGDRAGAGRVKRPSRRIGRGGLRIDSGANVPDSIGPAASGSADDAQAYDLSAPALASPERQDEANADQETQEKHAAPASFSGGVAHPFSPVVEEETQERLDTNQAARPASPAQERHKVLASWADGAKRLGNIVEDTLTHAPEQVGRDALRAFSGPLWLAREAMRGAVQAYERRQGEKGRPQEEDRKASQTPAGGYLTRAQLAADISRAKKQPRPGGAEPSGYDAVRKGIQNGVQLDDDEAAAKSSMTRSSMTRSSMTQASMAGGGSLTWTPGGAVRSAIKTGAEYAGSQLRGALTDENARQLGRLLFRGAALASGVVAPAQRALSAQALVNPPPEAEGFGLAVGAKLKQGVPAVIEGLGSIAGGAVDELVSAPSLLGSSARRVIGEKPTEASRRSRDENRKAIVEGVQNLPSAIGAIPGQISGWSEGAGEDFAQYRQLSAKARADSVLTPEEWDLIAYGFQPVAERGLEAGAVGAEVVGAGLGGLGLVRFGSRLARAAPDKPGGGGRPESEGERITREVIARAHNPKSGAFFSRALMDGFFRRAIERGEIKRSDVIITDRVVPPGYKGVGQAHHMHSKTGVHFDARGLPMFGPHARARIPFSKEEWTNMGYMEMAREASERLHGLIVSGRIEVEGLDPRELPKLEKRAETVKNFTWHHDLSTGEMQLVPRKLHADTGHVGWALGKGLVWLIQ